MFTMFGLVALAAGIIILLVFGWECIRSWCAKIDTPSEAEEFMKCAILAFVGLCIILTAVHMWVPHAG